MVKKILAGLIVLITILQIFSPLALALELEGSKTIEYTGRKITDCLLYKKGKTVSDVECSIVGYKTEDGKFYPAYCLNYKVDGAEKGNYNVDISSYTDNVQVWRVVTHGYPYTTNFNGIELSEDEAYLVTKMAVYCVTGNSAFSLYTYDEGRPKTVDTYRALDYLVNTVAVDESINKNTGTISVNRVGDFTLNGEYYSQDFSVDSIIDERSYEVKSEIRDFPEGTIIANLENQPQNVFQAGENFRILIPKSGLTKEINGSFDIVGKVKNYPVFFGDAKDSNKQNYIVTFDDFGDELATGTFNIAVNTGKVKVVKVDSESKDPLEGVTFELKREGTEEVIEKTTDENGEAIFDELLPGKYELKEKGSLEGYELSEETFSVEVKYNEETKVEVENDLIKGSIKIIKQDSENSNVRLKGVKFELYDQDMNLLETLETDEKGEAYSKDYPSVNKKYYLKEVKTIDGYSLDSEVHEITLLDNNVLEVYIKNVKTPKEPEVFVVEEKPEPQVEVVVDEPEVETVHEKPDPQVNVVVDEPEIIEKVVKLPKTGM